MANEQPKTHFAPAGRASVEITKAQTEALEASPMVNTLFDCVQEMVVILNTERQVVFANGRFLESMGGDKAKQFYGLRPGEAVGCIHALDPDAPDGCGTTEACQTCGAVKAILNAQNTGSDVQECSIIPSEGGDPLNLRVRTTQLALDDETYTVFAMEDVSHEKRREELERIFFHDILNTAGVVRGMAELFEMVSPEKQADFSQRIYRGADRLIDEINSQRVIVAAEQDTLVLNLEDIDTGGFIQDLVSMFESHDASHERFLKIAADSEDCVLITDRGLLSRVVSNMIKNALEASAMGETVTIECRSEGANVRFDVHNTKVMARDVTLQMFRRSFSTKGKGRGLGTYSMRLLGEKYLGGKIDFVSEEQTGTIFSARFPSDYVEPELR